MSALCQPRHKPHLKSRENDIAQQKNAHKPLVLVDLLSRLASVRNHLLRRRDDVTHAVKGAVLDKLST